MRILQGKLSGVFISCVCVFVFLLTPSPAAVNQGDIAEVANELHQQQFNEVSNELQPDRAQLSGYSQN